MDDRDSSNIITGWMEWVSLPAINVPYIKAKIDTGASTSALHTTNIEEFTRDGADRVRFTVHPWQENELDEVTVELPILDRRAVRSSSGHSEDRLVVSMPLVLCGKEVSAEVTLTSREEMAFRMLIGREALRQGFAVDPALSYCGGKPPKELRDRNQAAAE